MRNCNYCSSVLYPKLNLGLRPVVNSLSLQVDLDVNQYLIEMTICDECGLHQLLHEIDSTHFYTDYMTPSNWKNEPHMSKLVGHIMDLAKLDDSIIDIGCNDGKFLLELKHQGFTKLQGVEPTKNTVRQALDAGLKITNDYFDVNLAKTLLSAHGKFNVVIARQVLEHIEDIEGFLESARILLGDEGFLIIEVPDSEINFKYSDYGVWEEHLNYFTKASLTRIFEESGWEIKNWYRSIFSGWCQTFIVTPSVARSELENKLGRATVALEVLEFDSWASNFKSFKKKVMETINELVGESGRVGLFGVGSRSISTLFSTDLINRITSAYDDSPDKLTKYIPNTNLKISPTSSINNDNVDLILLGVNFENEAKILQRFQSEKFLVKSILPPSQILLWSESPNQ
jgi:2-polyprenyl-3-methyl-5-hydroxy-6-metoxy-1,4-benzoquinol methylase